MADHETTRAADRDAVGRFVDQGDEAAFRQLYRCHAAALYRFAVLRVGQDDAADIVQETWLRAARHLATFQWKSSLRTWLVGIALNCCRERLRRRQRDEVATDELDPDGGHAPLTARPHRQASHDLRAAIDALPTRAREVVVLHDVEGYTHAEIGSILGIDAGTSKSQLSRARAALRVRLESTGS